MTKIHRSKGLGAWLAPEGVHFRIWAPTHSKVEVVGTAERIALEQAEDGFFEGLIRGAGEGFRYKLSIDGEGPFPDPWSRSQPEGVHGPSEIVDDTRFSWTDSAWRGVPRESLVMYELHVGTATPEGTFEALIPKLGELRALGVTALELMPLASFPGTRNWGYDGVSLFAPQASYGGREGLRALIDAAHGHGLAVLIDVVYNHFGPDGNYLRCYSPHYFTGHHHTPWGEAVNYDDAGSGIVRELVLRNVEMWIRDFHADGLRLDAAHAILDDSSPHLLTEIAARAREAAEGRELVVIAEDESNDARLVRSASAGGTGLDGVWADDFHHQLRRAFAGDHQGYYRDYTGSAADLARTLNQGWFYEGQVSPHQGKPRGTKAEGVEPWQLVHCIQNHDQIGNRPLGDRLGEAVSPDAYRAMSMLLLLSPYTPLLFMGQEWNASTPFLYFTDHHEELGRLVTEGRRKEFKDFEGFEGQEVPDPQAPSTFERSKLQWAERSEPGHEGVLALYRALLSLRASDPCLLERKRGTFSASALGENALLLERTSGDQRLQLYVCLRGTLEARIGEAALVLHSEESRFGGDGQTPLVDGVLRLRGARAALLRKR